jgi:glutathione peroxidase
MTKEISFFTYISHLVRRMKGCVFHPPFFPYLHGNNGLRPVLNTIYMKKQILLIILVATTGLASAQTATFHDFFGRDILGNNIDFSVYHGKKVMVVNTASFCAFTPQFDDLQSLYEQYNQNNFEIIGFPCNDFDSQDPGADSTILEFCTSEYGVTFQMMSKIIAVLPDTAPVFRWLQEEALNGVANAPVTWNFNKFLIDEAGHWVEHHNSLVSPTASSITNWIMSPSALSVGDENSNGDAALVQVLGTNESGQLVLKALGNGLPHVQIELFSVDGRSVAVLHTGRMGSGETLSYSTTSLSVGLYLIRATTKDGQQTLCYVVGE